MIKEQELNQRHPVPERKNKGKNCFLKRLEEIANFAVRLNKEKKIEQITHLGIKKSDITTDTTDIKKIMRIFRTS